MQDDYSGEEKLSSGAKALWGRVDTWGPFEAQDKLKPPAPKEKNVVAGLLSDLKVRPPEKRKARNFGLAGWVSSS